MSNLGILKKLDMYTKGAAALVLLVGISIFLASEEGAIDLMGYLTLGAIVVEFLLLWMYANSVTSTGLLDEEDDDFQINLDTSSLENAINDLHINLVQNLSNIDRTDEIVSAIREINIDDEININVEPLNDELDKLATELATTKSSIDGLVSNIEGLAGEMVDLQAELAAYRDEDLKKKSDKR